MMKEISNRGRVERRRGKEQKRRKGSRIVIRMRRK